MDSKGTMNHNDIIIITFLLAIVFNQTRVPFMVLQHTDTPPLTNNYAFVTGDFKKNNMIRDAFFNL